MPLPHPTLHSLQDAERNFDAIGTRWPGPSAYILGASNVRMSTGGTPGATGDGTTDDTTAVQAHLDAATQGTVYFPAGTYRITSALRIPQGTSLLGDGVLSIIQADGCDGLDFAVSNNVAPVRVQSLRLEGDGTATGIKVMGDGDTGRTTGVTFQDVYVNNFETGMHLRSLWASRIVGCTIYNVYTGIKFAGQAVKNVVDSCEILCGTGARVNSTGVLVDQASDYTSGVNPRRPEDVQVHHTRIYGFDFGIDHVRCLYAGYSHNDIDATTLVGIRYGQTAGGVSILSNWIALTGSDALYGIYGNEAAAGAVDAVPIVGNTVRGNGTLHASSVGILIDRNQHEALVAANNVQGFQNSDLYINVARRIRVERNGFYSTVPAASVTARTARFVSFADNYLQRPWDVAGGTNQDFYVGANFGAQSTLVEGQATILRGATSVAVTFAGQPGAPPNFNSAGGLTVHVDVQAPSVNLGPLWVTGVSDAGFTINCGTAPGANATVRFIARSHLPGY